MSAAAESWRAARTLVGESPSPAFLVDADGVIQAWNTGAGYFFGIPAWMSSAHRCTDVLHGLGCAGNCPLENARLVPNSVVMGFDLRGVRDAEVRHLPMHDDDGLLLGVVHVLIPIGQATT